LRPGLRVGIPLGGLLVAGAVVLAPRGAAAQLSQQELHFLYELNRARHDPPAWAAEQGLGARTGGDGQPTTLVGVAPRPPLALNGVLVDSSGFKAEEMAANDYFAHQSAVGPAFLWPNELVRNVFGYPLPAMVPAPGGGFFVLPDDFNSLESLACGFGSGTSNLALAIHALTLLVVDAGVPSLGHRRHLLATDDFNSIFTEAGVGYGSDLAASCRNYWAFQTGVTDPPGRFLTGVAFQDGDGDDLFDPGEGLAGVTVSVGAAQTATDEAGGWSLEVAEGTHGVSCVGGGFAGTASALVPVSGASRQVDCVSGFDGLFVDFVAVWEPPRTLSAALALAAASLLARHSRMPPLRVASRSETFQKRAQRST
jgi:hypothetical protein